MALIRPINSTQRKIRQLELIVTGIGTASLSGAAASQATLTDNGVGDYTIAFKENYGQIPTCIPVCTTANCIIDTMVASASQVQITLVDNTATGAAKDGDFHILISGSDDSDKY